MRPIHSGVLHSGLRLVGLVRSVVVAAVFSGVPSTLHAVVTGRPLLSSTRAAGTLLGRATVPRGVAVHVLVSTGWTAAIAAVLPPRRPVASGALLGAVIGALDLSIARRWCPAIARLPRRPQMADHVAFGALAAMIIARERPEGRRHTVVGRSCSSTPGTHSPLRRQRTTTAHTSIGSSCGACPGRQPNLGDPAGRAQP